MLPSKVSPFFVTRKSNKINEIPTRDSLTEVSLIENSKIKNKITQNQSKKNENEKNILLTKKSSVGPKKDTKFKSNVSERLSKGWWGISYVRKLSVDKLRVVQVQSVEKPRKTSLDIIQKSKINKTKIQKKEEELKKPNNEYFRFKSLIEPFVNQKSKERFSIYERSKEYLSKKEDKITSLKMKFGQDFPPNLISSKKDDKIMSKISKKRSLKKMNMPLKKIKKNVDSNKNEMQKKLENYIENEIEKINQYEKKKLTTSKKRNTDSNVALRNCEWMKKKEEKLEGIRKEKYESVLNSCTFKPKINRGFITFN